MIALTGIVFSLAVVMVQFSATAYSPRLVPWIARDPVLSHALGTFTATFLYAIAALTRVDRTGSGKVPFVSLWVVVALLVASVAMFISLIHRISVLRRHATSRSRTRFAQPYATSWPRTFLSSNSGQQTA